MKKLRELPDGSLLDPREPIEKCPEGYTADPRNKNRCLPILCECSLRQYEFKKGSCCPNGQTKMVCGYNQKVIGPQDCVSCKADPAKKFGSLEKV